MANVVREIHGVRVLEYDAAGKELRSEADAIEIITAASEQDTSVVVVAAEHLSPDFFHLRTGVAGAFLQKFLTYQLRIVIAGEVGQYTAESASLRAFVLESNRGAHIWFVANVSELEERLARVRA